jgi:hypothetical protein
MFRIRRHVVPLHQQPHHPAFNSTSTPFPTKKIYPSTNSISLPSARILPDPFHIHNIRPLNLPHSLHLTITQTRDQYIKLTIRRRINLRLPIPAFLAFSKRKEGGIRRVRREAQRVGEDIQAISIRAGAEASVEDVV